MLLVSRNRVVTATAGPARIPGRGTPKKCLPPPRPRGRMTLRRLADGRPAAQRRHSTNKRMQPSRVLVQRCGCVFPSRPVDPGTFAETTPVPLNASLGARSCSPNLDFRSHLSAIANSVAELFFGSNRIWRSRHFPTAPQKSSPDSAPIRLQHARRTNLRPHAPPPGSFPSPV